MKGHSQGLERLLRELRDQNIDRAVESLDRSDSTELFKGTSGG